MKKNKEKKKAGLIEKIKESPINYFSDLFVCVAIILWIVVILVLIVASAYAMMKFQDMSGWSYVTELVNSPITIGLGAWMIKNSVQHAIANNKGKQAHMDFPPVPDAEVEWEQQEEELENGSEE